MILTLRGGNWVESGLVGSGCMPFDPYVSDLEMTRLLNGSEFGMCT